MALVGDGIPPITEPWPVADIVYVSLMGVVMLAAFLEWFLWLAAFVYCLIKAFQKAETWTTRVMAVLVMLLFTALRTVFLPIMIVTLPLPGRITQYFPESMVSFFQWFAFWSFAALLTIPWLFCVYQLVTNSLGRKKRIKKALDEKSAPKVVIVMPCYKEVPQVLLTAINSVVSCDYPPSCLHVFVSFDGDKEDDLYLQTIRNLGVPLTLSSYPVSIDVSYRGTRITISRFDHGGKRQCQKKTYKLIDKIYTEYLLRNDNLFILFIDSDCILDKVCIQNFVYEMELKPGSKQNMLAMTGVITSTTPKTTLITLLQDMEYIHGQLFERSVESGCGAVTCLPGALTILRFSAFRKMAKLYFADKAEQCDDLFDYGKCHLGEDRWLTHLFMIGAQERYQIQMCTGAFCKTEAVQTYRSLLKQRRRWFLGFITNEVCMLTDVRLWKRYTILCIVRFMQNTIRTTGVLFFIMVLSIITTSNKVANLPVGFIAVSLGLNWLLMIYFGLRLKRFKVWLYPIMFVLNPFFNWLYMVYGIFTAGQRTWGGPRTDAGAADTHTTVQQAIEYAEATGDDLNVVPETFKPATKLKKRPRAVPLQPSDEMQGQFAAAEKAPGGCYQQGPGLLMSGPGSGPRDSYASNMPLNPEHRRDSVQSFMTGSSADNVVTMPRRIESIMVEQDMQRYIELQAAKQETGSTNAHEHADQVAATQQLLLPAPCEARPSTTDRSPARRSYTAPLQSSPLTAGEGNSALADESPGRRSVTQVLPRVRRLSGLSTVQTPGNPMDPASGPSSQRQGLLVDTDEAQHVPVPPEAQTSPVQSRRSSGSGSSRLRRSPLGRLAKLFKPRRRQPSLELQERQEEGLILHAPHVPEVATEAEQATSPPRRKRIRFWKLRRSSKSSPRQ